MKVGDRFRSYEEFSEALGEYKQKVHNEYWIRDARTIENQRSKHPETVSNAKKALKYYYMHVACVRGGRKFKPKSENPTRNSSTAKVNCPAAISLRMSKCFQFLEVTKINEAHNHSSSLSYFKSLPQQQKKLRSKVNKNTHRVLKKGVKKNVAVVKKVGTGCSTTLKDLIKLTRTNEKKDFEDCIDMLKNVYKCDVDILLAENGTCMGLYFQDQRMKQYFEAFPEVLFIDGTYCLEDIRTATYVVMVEDSNGLSEVVAVCLLTQENEDSIEFFIHNLKRHNPAWENVQVIMSDKEKMKRNVFKKHFPDAKLMICLFHVFQLFNRDISNRKMGISTEEVRTSKEYLHKLLNSSSELEYTEIYEEMMATVPSIVQTYFLKNWANIKEQWVKYLTFKNLCLSNTTNNRLKYLNLKLKNLINGYTPLDSFIKNIFALVNGYRVRNDIKNFQMLHKRPAKLITDDSELLYTDLLTVFAFEKVKKQFDLSADCKEFIPLGYENFMATSSEGLLRVSANSCECMFRTSTMLPCRHIFRCRTLLSLPLFDKDLCLSRWTKDYCQEIINANEGIKTESSEIIKSEEGAVNTQIQPNFSKTQIKCLTSHQKFRMMDEQGRILAKLCSEISTPAFYEKINFVKNLIKEWSDEQTAVNDEVLINSKTLEEDECSVKSECESEIELEEEIMPPRILKRKPPKKYGTTGVGLKKIKKECYTENHSKENVIDNKAKIKLRAKTCVEAVYLPVEEYFEEDFKHKLESNDEAEKHTEGDLDEDNYVEEEYLEEDFGY